MVTHIISQQTLPSLWTLVSFEECLSKEHYKVGKLKSSEFATSGKFPVIDQGQGQIAGFSDRDDLVYQGNLPVVLFGDHTKIFKYVDFPFICGADGVKVLIPNNDIVTPEYLFYCAQILPIPNRGYSRHYQFLREQQIPLPTLPEQRRIVAILRKADELRQLRRQANTRAQQLLPALFDRMFGLQWKTWPQGKIGDIIYFETGKSISAHPFPAQENKWGILKVSAVTIGEFRPEENKELPDDATFDPSFEVRHGDLLVSRANTTELVGASALVYNPPPRLIIPDKLWRAVPKADVDTNFAFLHALFNLSEIRREISRRATGTSASMKNISQEKFLDIDIPIPPPTEQHKYGQLSQLYRGQIFADQNKTTGKLDQLFNSFLARAFTGELTTTWREAHTAELTEAAERDWLLNKPIALEAKSLIIAPPELGTPTLTVKPSRAIYADLDAATQSLWAAAQTRPAYFRPADLLNGTDLTAVQAEAGLHLLAALGFVRQVGLEGQLVYRRVDPITESAAKPEFLP